MLPLGESVRHFEIGFDFQWESLPCCSSFLVLLLALIELHVMSYRSSISWRSFSEKDGLGSKELCGPDGVAKEFPKWAKTQKAPASTLKTNYYSKRFLIVDSENAIIVVPEGTSEADARKKWNDSFKLFVLRDPKDNGKIVETRYTVLGSNAALSQKVLRRH